MDAEAHLSDGRRPRSLVTMWSWVSRGGHFQDDGGTTNFSWLRSCNVAEEAQSAGSHHVGDWLAGIVSLA